MQKTLPIFLLLFFLGNQVLPQADTLTVTDIEPVSISATKISTERNRSPLSVSTYTATPIQESFQQLSLQEFTTGVPGLFATNATNMAQDLRVSIRGFGARSAFGIRGIRIIVDGIPETTPDGQGQVDNLNLGIIQTMEVVRGPASALYGNAAGGVISIRTVKDFEKNFVKVGTTIGYFNALQYQATTGFKVGNSTIVLHANRQSSDGYRALSRFVNNNFNARIGHKLSEKSTLDFLFNFADSPQADDPGSLLPEAVQENRRQANAQNLLFRAGEEIRHWKTGLSYRHTYNDNSHFNSYIFYAKRDFTGRQPFENGGVVGLSRVHIGLGGHYAATKKTWGGEYKLHAGYEMATQADNRSRFQNLEGQQGELGFEQLESFSNAGGFLTNQFLKGRWLLSAAIRYDWNNVSVTDHFKQDGNGSGSKTYRNWNPSLGVSWRALRGQYVFANFSSSFEAPALSELSANPTTGSAGFNASLLPQRAKNLEIGVKGEVKSKSHYELSFFRILTKSEVVPFELDTFPGRLFYRNAGRGERHGLEFSFKHNLTDALQLELNYAYSDFVFKKYELNDSVNFNGKMLPGLPRHFGNATFAYIGKGGFHARLQGRYVGEIPANDANTVFDSAYFLLNFNAGWKINTGKLQCTPFFGVNNILGTEYNDNIRINAFGGRYYEPGPGINFYGGVRVAL